MMAPILATDEQYPIAVPLTLVGYTSGVYTVKAMNPPVAKARMMNRNKVMISLQGKRKVHILHTLIHYYSPGGRHMSEGNPVYVCICVFDFRYTRVGFLGGTYS